MLTREESDCYRGARTPERCNDSHHTEAGPSSIIAEQSSSAEMMRNKGSFSHLIQITLLSFLFR